MGATVPFLRASLRALIAIAVLFGLVTIAGSYWYFIEETNEIKEEQYKTISAVAELKSGQINQWRKDCIEDIRLIVENPIVAKVWRDIFRGDASAEIRAELSVFLNKFFRTSHYSNALLVDSDGTLLMAASDHHDPIAAASLQAIASALKTQQPVISDLFRCPNGGVHVDIVAVVPGVVGQPSALLIMRSDVASYLYPLLQSWPTSSPSAESLLVQQIGEEIVFLNELRHLPNAALSLKMPISRTDLIGVQAVLGRQGKSEGIDYRNVRVLGDLRSIPESPWFLVVKVDVEELLAEARYRAGVIGVITAAFMLIIVSMAAFLDRQRQARQYKELYEAEHRQRQTQQEFRTTLYSIGDAVITTESMGRVREMNPIAETLTGWTEAEAKGLPLEKVFCILNENTREQITNPVQRVLQGGTVIGPANHTLLSARGGTERPVAVNAAPIREDDGSLSGVVLVFHDQTEERNAKKQLTESEERLRLALAASNQGLYDLNVQTGECTVNDEYARMLGYDPGEFTETNAAWQQRLHPDDRDEVYRKYEDYVAGRISEYRVEFRQRTKSGDWKWILSVGRIVSYSNDGKPLRMIGTHIDITDHKHAEIALRQNEITAKRIAVERFTIAEIGRVISSSQEIEEVYERFAAEVRRIISFDRIAINLVDPDKETVSCRYALGPAIAGRNNGDKFPLAGSATAIAIQAGRGIMIPTLPEEDLHVRLPAHIPLRQAGLNSSILVPLIYKGQAFGALSIMSCQQDKYSETDIQLAGNVAAQISGAIANMLLLKERQKAEEALKESQARLTAIIQAEPECVKLVAVDGTLLEMNAVGLKLIEADSLDQCIGKSVYPLVVPEYRSAFRLLTERACSGEDGTLEFEIIGMKGMRRWMETHATRLSDANGDTIGALSITRDITERKRMEEERRKLEAKFLQAQKMEAVGQLAGGVAHDFNNMLGVIMGFTELAKLKIAPSDPSQGYLDEVKTAAERSADITRQLLAFARKQTIAPKVLNLNDTIFGMLKMLSRIIGEDISLEWKPGDNLWLVKMDPSQIDQILVNLAVNARDAISGGGKITIATSNQNLDDDFCKIHEGASPGSYAMLTVSDNGCGMDKVTLEKLFEPFFTTKKPGKGTGLGLSTVYGIIKQNKGFIHVASEPGSGSTFRICLPRQLEKPLSTDETLQGTHLPTGTETVLLVEDEEALLKLTKMLLEQLCYTVLATPSPLAAIRMAAEYTGEINLLMTDVVMPEMSGRDLLKNLVNIRPTIRSLFMSGYTSDIIAKHGVLDDSTHFVQKPFSKDIIANKVRDALS
jgi:PAS domain S-box-containing protein